MSNAQTIHEIGQFLKSAGVMIGFLFLWAFVESRAWRKDEPLEFEDADIE